MRVLQICFVLLLPLALWTGAVADSHASDDCCEVTIEVQVPAGTGTVYLAGSLDQLGPWRPDGLELGGEGTMRRTVLTLPRGTELEYKFTLGSWQREGLGPSGTVMANFRLTVADDARQQHQVVDFKKDPMQYIADWRRSGVRGTLVYWTDVPSQFLEQDRHVSVWLPPEYQQQPERRFRVLYMHDGQNLFDPRIANTGVDWGVDESLVRLVSEGMMDPVIVVAAWSSSERGAEYSPWHRAPDYARFLIEELMPRVNREYRTLTGPDNTAVMGSSMGGLLSFYLVSRHPEVFGACGCVSSHFILSESVAARFIPSTVGDPDETPYILLDIEDGLRVPQGTRYWFDYGSEGLDGEYGPTHAAVQQWLERQGLEQGSDFVVRLYEGADHNEASWRERLADPLLFLFGEVLE
ncbi:MAG: alpha/beta hydrolase-fold protein [Xanthomonadales bacterium]|nr:alpha/beta hydrolase-fold protein [Xanthomonadales bacterium]